MVFRDPVVNDPSPTAFAVALGRPTKLPTATRARNHIPGVGLLPEESLERQNRILPEQPEGFVGEVRVFLKDHPPTMPRPFEPASRIVILSMIQPH